MKDMLSGAVEWWSHFEGDGGAGAGRRRTVGVLCVFWVPLLEYESRGSGVS